MDDITECQLCGEPEESGDPLGHFFDKDVQEMVLAHAQCGEDAGLDLA